ncbi:unnamed protein product [Linum trigynum]|uniref:Uncharacterized protein n=1 Tax=Linum trigynum TaxID=586398 RepID=A0AAV2DRN3_9ROSI
MRWRLGIAKDAAAEGLVGRGRICGVGGEQRLGREWWCNQGIGEGGESLEPRETPSMDGMEGEEVEKQSVRGMSPRRFRSFGWKSERGRWWKLKGVENRRGRLEGTMEELGMVNRRG